MALVVEGVVAVVSLPDAGVFITMLTGGSFVAASVVVAGGVTLATLFVAGGVAEAVFVSAAGGVVDAMFVLGAEESGVAGEVVVAVWSVDGIVPEALAAKPFGWVGAVETSGPGTFRLASNARSWSFVGGVIGEPRISSCSCKTFDLSLRLSNSS